MKYITSILFWMGWCFLIQGQPIIEMEYFYDNDPGVGNGTPLNITSGDTVDITIPNLPISSLSPGFHTLSIRAKDSANVWSLYVNRTFFIQTNQVNNSPAITSLEYFYDSDPGIGNGTSLPITAGDTIDTNFSGIPNTGLSTGFHTLFTRAKYADGTWGLFTGRTIYVQQQQTIQPAPPIAKAEWFYDTDPGAGNGIPLNITQGDTIDASFSNLNTANLNIGFHTLFVRFFNTDGSWSLYQGRTFYVQEASSQDSIPLVGMEHFIDIDTGGGTGIYQALHPTSDLDTIVQIPVGNLPFGTHQLFVRVKDSMQNWSFVRQDSFIVGNCASFFPEVLSSDTTTFCAGGSVTLYPSQAYSSYQWSNGSSDSSITVNQTGIYTLTVTDTAGCPGTSNDIGVTVLLNPPPFIQSNGSFTFCEGDSIMLSTAQNHDSYLWSNGATTPSIYVTDSGEYSVMVINNGLCEANSEPVMTFQVPRPAPIDILALGGDTLKANGVGDYYRWYVNDSLMEPVSGIITAQISGRYQVAVGVDGCESQLSPPFEYWLTGIEESGLSLNLIVYPNPFKDIIEITIHSSNSKAIQFVVFDLLGREWARGERRLSGIENISIDLGHLSSGVYLLKVSDIKSQAGNIVRLIKVD